MRETFSAVRLIVTTLVGENNGYIRIFRDSFNSSTQVDTINEHSTPIKCIHYLALLDNGNTATPATILVASGSIDKTLSTHVFSADRLSLHVVYSGKHVTSLSSLVLLDTVDNMLAGGDWGGEIIFGRPHLILSILVRMNYRRKMKIFLNMIISNQI